MFDLIPIASPSKVRTNFIGYQGSFTKKNDQHFVFVLDEIQVLQSTI